MDFFKRETNVRTPDTITLKTFASRLSNLLYRNNMQKNELADLLNIKAVAITKYTKGQTLPSIPVLQEIARQFNVTTDYLLGLDYWPMKREHYIYFYPEGEIKYNFLISLEGEKKEICGSLEYIFGFNVTSIDDYRNRRADFPFLCFRFKPHNEDLLEALFYSKKINVGLFLHKVSYQLGFRFISDNLCNKIEQEAYFANLVVYNESGFKSLEGRLFATRESRYSIFSYSDYSGESSIDPSDLPKDVIENWIKFTDEEKHEFMMNRLELVKNLRGVLPAFYE